MEYKMLISRYIDTGVEYIGNGFVLDYYDNVISHEFTTLELSWKDNKRRVSCIPKGSYIVVKRKSKKYGNHFHILDVPNRDFILIHVLNYHTQTLGCIGVGSDLGYLNDDKEIDLLNSSKTLKKLYKMMPERFELEIIEV